MNNLLKIFFQASFFMCLVMANGFAGFSDGTNQDLELGSSPQENTARYYNARTKRGYMMSESDWIHAVGNNYYASHHRLPELVMVPEHWQEFLVANGLQNVLPTQPCKKAKDDDERRADMAFYQGTTTKYGPVSNSLEEMFRTLQKGRDYNLTTDTLGEQISLRNAAVHAVNQFFHVCGPYMVPEKKSWNNNLEFKCFGQESLTKEKNEFIRSLDLAGNPYSSAPRINWFLGRIISFNKNVLEERERLGGTTFSPEEQFLDFYQSKQEEKEKDDEAKGLRLKALHGMRDFWEEQEELRKAKAEEKVARKAAEQESARIAAAEELAAHIAAETAATQAAEEEAARKAAEQQAARIAAAEELAAHVAAETAATQAAEEAAALEDVETVRVAESQDSASRSSPPSSNATGFFDGFLARMRSFLSGSNTGVVWR
jgi:chemotaxis protein histidine kinase CheA